MRITHYTITHQSRPLPGADREPAISAPMLVGMGNATDTDYSVTIPPARHLPEGEHAVALAAQLAASSLLHDPVGRAASCDPAERRATLHDGDRVLATATALEDPHTAADRLAELTGEIERLTQIRTAVLQVTLPGISRVRALRGRGVSDRSAAASTGYSHTQIATIRSRPMVADAIRWRAINLLAESGLALQATGPGPHLDVRLWNTEDQEPRVILSAISYASGGVETARAAVALLEAALHTLADAGLAAEVRRITTYTGADDVDVPEYWISERD